MHRRSKPGTSTTLALSGWLMRSQKNIHQKLAQQHQMTSSASKKRSKNAARTNYWPRRRLRIDKKCKTLRKMRHFSRNWWLVVRRARARGVARVAVRCANSSMIRNSICLSVSATCNRQVPREVRLNRRSLSDSPNSISSRSCWSAGNHSRVTTRIGCWRISCSMRSVTAPLPSSRSPSRLPRSRRERRRQLWTSFNHANLSHQSRRLHRKWRQKSA